MHENSISNEIMHNIGDKITWGGLIVMIGIFGIGVTTMEYKKFKKMLIQNGTFCSMLIIIILVLIKLKKALKIKKIKSLKI